MSAVAMAPSLVVQDLALSFGGIQVLQGIALQMRAGEITGLIGPNGAGKTSFFNCLTGLYAPQQGSMRLGDIGLGGIAPTGRAALGFSRSFQHVALCPELSIAENVMIGLDRQSAAGWLDAFLPLPRGRRERARHRELALAALARLGIVQVADEAPASLPPGVLRLAEIARAIAGAQAGRRRDNSSRAADDLTQARPSGSRRDGHCRIRRPRFRRHDRRAGARSRPSCRSGTR